MKLDKIPLIAVASQCIMTVEVTSYLSFNLKNKINANLHYLQITCTALCFLILICKVFLFLRYLQVDACSLIYTSVIISYGIALNLSIFLPFFFYQRRQLSSTHWTLIFSFQQKKINNNSSHINIYDSFFAHDTYKFKKE